MTLFFVLCGGYYVNASTPHHPSIRAIDCCGKCFILKGKTPLKNSGTIHIIMLSRGHDSRSFAFWTRIEADSRSHGACTECLILTTHPAQGSLKGIPEQSLQVPVIDRLENTEREGRSRCPC